MRRREGGEVRHRRRMSKEVCSVGEGRLKEVMEYSMVASRRSIYYAAVRRRRTTQPALINTKTETTEMSHRDNEEEKINVYGARVHNLKNIDVEIPRNTLTVITGLSGSGKSSLAFDTILAEEQRLYL